MRIMLFTPTNWPLDSKTNSNEKHIRVFKPNNESCYYQLSCYVMVEKN